MKKKGCAVVFLFYGLVMLALALKFVSDSPSMADGCVSGIVHSLS